MNPSARRKEVPKKEFKGQLAVILVRGVACRPHPIARTLEFLKLSRKNQCVVVANTPQNEGMVRKVKDYVTWGEITPETFQELVAKRGEEYLGRLTDSKEKYHYRYLEINGKKYKKYFSLNPPRKGFERKGIKVSFTVGGALGYRGAKINDLLKRMM